MRSKTRLSETTLILDFGLAISSGQITRRYFANFQHSPNLDKSTFSFVECDTLQRSCNYSLATHGKQQVDCCICNLVSFHQCNDESIAICLSMDLKDLSNNRCSLFHPFACWHQTYYCVCFIDNKSIASIMVRIINPTKLICQGLSTSFSKRNTHPSCWFISC